MPTIFFSVGEPSGDLHGANLIRELRERSPDTRCVGFGGPRMAEAGCELETDLTQFAVMGLLRVIVHLRRFIGLLFQANKYLREKKPDAVVLIDYPGFNWWIARRATAHGIPVFYYGTPQMWAWAPWRIKKIRKFVDHVLCKLPFEPAWFESRGCRATYVGHPYFDELASRELDTAFVKSQQDNATSLVTILPGSRNQEVAANLPWFLKTVAHLQREDKAGNVRFAIASFSAAQAVTARQMIAEADLPAPEATSVHIDRTPELIESATACLACSGSVSLELLYHTKPSIVLYHTSRTMFRFQNRFRTSRYITLVNLLATDNIVRDAERDYDPDKPGCESVPMPEYLTCEDRSADIARRLCRLLSRQDERQAVQSQLAELRKKFAVPGASQRAARYILANLPGSNRDKTVFQNTAPAPKMLQSRLSRRESA